MNEIEAHTVDLRTRVRQIIHGRDTALGGLFDIAIMIAIIASICVMAFTIDPGMDRWSATLNGMEWFFTMLFTIEYALRLWTADSSRLYARSFFGIIDLLAILPAYVILVVGPEMEYLAVLRALRVARIIRVFRLFADVGRLRTTFAVFLTLMTGGFIWYFLRTPERTVIVLSTGSESGLYHRMGREVKNVVESAHPDLTIELRTSGGSNDNIRALENGKAQIALVQNDDVSGESVRSIAALHPEILHLISRVDANIRTLEDLTGRRVATGAPGSGTLQITRELLAFADISLDADQARSLSTTKAISQLENGEIDAAFFLSGLGSSEIREAMANPGLTLSGIHVGESDTGAEATATRFTEGFRIYYPNVAPHSIPQMAYEGRPASPIASLSVQAILACSAGLDQDVVVRITRTLFEKRAVLSSRETAFSYLNEFTTRSGLQFPLHPGAENYYFRQEPGFLAENAETMGFLLTLVLLAWSAANWFRKWYSQNQKNRIDTYYRAIDTIIQRLNDPVTLQELDELESEFLKIRKQAADELVREKLAADESFIIYQNMLNVCQSMLFRIRERT